MKVGDVESREAAAVAAAGGTPGQQPALQPSRIRWVVCLLQCMSGGLNAFAVSTYAAIWWLVSDVYGVAPENVYLLALVSTIFFIPGSMLSIYLYAKYGLGHILIGSALLNFASLWIRCVGSFSYNAPAVVDVYGMYDGMYAAANKTAQPYPITNKAAASNAFAVQLFGQIVSAIGNPLVASAPPRIANDWFPKGERDLAMHLMTQSFTIGTGFAGIIPAYQAYSGQSISYMLLWQAVVGTGVLALNLMAAPVLFGPTVHADIDAYLQYSELRKSVDASTVLAVFRQMLLDFGAMLTDVNFVLLLLAFTVQGGAAFVFLGVVGQLIGPCGYDEAIMSGVLTGFSFAGVVGSLILANVLRMWQRGRSIVQKAWFAVCGGMCLWCLATNKPGNAVNIVVAYTIYGIAVGPLVPVTLEYAAEMTYPIPADNSATLLWIALNYFVLFVTLGVAPVLASDPVSLTCSSVTSKTAIVLMAFAVVGAVVALPMKATYRRMAVSEKAGDQQLQSPQRVMPQ